jgi:hypothetical protein
VLQRTCQVLAGDTPEILAARVFGEECRAYPEALRQLIAGDVPSQAGGVPAVTTSTASLTSGARLISLAVLLVCAAIYGWSGVGKLTSAQDARLFVKAILPSIDERAAAVVVSGASAAELALSAWLLVCMFTPKARPRLALGIFAASAVVMAALLALAIARGFEGSCGCFGSGGAGASTAVLRTACLSVIAIMGIVYTPRRPRADAGSAR